MKSIPYGKQSISALDRKAVLDVLRSEFLTQGPLVPTFEKAVAYHCNAKYGVAVNSATSALHIACLALGLRKGDRLWTSPITFIASANCGLYCGAIVDFVDIDKRTFNLCPIELENKLLIAKKAGKLPKIVVAVHMCGQPCNMKEIFNLSTKYGFKIIEDASHAIGAKYLNEPVGNCKYSDITVFSFHPVKIITTAEGGIAITNNKYYANKMGILRSHGITNLPQFMGNTQPDEIWNYQQIDLGFNYRMTDLQAALGLSQLHRINDFINKRLLIAKRYEKLNNIPYIKLPWQHPDSLSSYHLYVIQINNSKSNITQKKVYDSLREAGIMVNLHYIPVYRQPYYTKLGFKKGYCKNAEEYFKSSISIPIFNELKFREQGYIISTLKSLY